MLYFWWTARLTARCAPIHFLPPFVRPHTHFLPPVVRSHTPTFLHVYCWANLCCSGWLKRCKACMTCVLICGWNELWTIFGHVLVTAGRQYRLSPDTVVEHTAHNPCRVRATAMHNSFLFPALAEWCGCRLKIQSYCPIVSERSLSTVDEPWCR